MTTSAITSVASAAKELATPQVATSRKDVSDTSVHIAPPKAAQAAATSVTLSAAAQSAQEAAETPAQTAQEALGNDRQAQHLLAKEQAVAKAYQGR